MPLLRRGRHLFRHLFQKKLTDDEIAERLPSPELLLQVDVRRRILAVLDEQIQRIEKVVQAQGVLRPEFRILRTIQGIGLTLGLTIMYETGDIGRFARVGRYASYCRCVPTERRSNQRKKGQGNRKNGQSLPLLGLRRSRPLRPPLPASGQEVL